MKASKKRAKRCQILFAPLVFVLRHQSQFLENAAIVACQLKYLKGFCHFFWLRNPSQRKFFNYFPIWLFVSVITVYSLRHIIRRTRIRVYVSKVICVLFLCGVYVVFIPHMRTIKLQQKEFRNHEMLHVARFVWFLHSKHTTQAAPYNA